MNTSHTDRDAPVPLPAGRSTLPPLRLSLQQVLDGTAVLPSDSDLRSWSALDLVPFVRAFYELAVKGELLAHTTRFRVLGTPAHKAH